MMGIGRMKTYPFHPQANGTVERWNRTLARDLASFVATGSADWDEHPALACLRYNTGVCAATGTTPFKAIFGIDAFEAWGQVDQSCFEEEPDSLAERLAVLHKQLLCKGMDARGKANKAYDRKVNPIEFFIGDRVLVWSEMLNNLEGKKIIKPWIGPYLIKGRLGRVGYVVEAEVGDKVARLHANRMRKIPAGLVESGDPEDGVFPDSLRTLQKIRTSKFMRNHGTEDIERHLKVVLGGKKSPRWNAESDLPGVVV